MTELTLPRISVLLVDDEEGPLTALASYLNDEDEAWDVTTATSASEALDKISSAPQPFDVVVTDLVMEDRQSGIDVLRRAKEIDPLTMVIVVTAFDDDLDRYRAFENGAFDCLSKNTPKLVPAREIAVKVRAAADLRRLALERISQSAKITALGRYLDAQVVEAIEATPEVLKLQPRLVTVAFWDIRGFSRVADELRAAPTLLSGFLEDYFELAERSIAAAGGVLDKFIGDGVMGLFGALTESDDDGRLDAQRAVEAALAFRSGFKGLAERWIANWGMSVPAQLSVDLGCGLHTGEVLIGSIGTTGRDQFTALGTVVNFAARLEGYAKHGEVLISRPTKMRVDHAFDVATWRVIEDVKNIHGEFEIFEATKPKRS